MASAMCQAYPTFYSDYNGKTLFISVSETFMKSSLSVKTTVFLTIYQSAQWNIVNFTWYESDHISIKFCKDKKNIISLTNLWTVFILYTNTVFILTIFHQT